MTEKARHTSGGMMLGQPVSCKNERKSRIAGRREPIFLAGKPMHSRIRVSRIKRVMHWRLERFVMRRHRSILQTARNIKPAEAVFLQHEWRVASDSIKAALVSGWSKLWRLVQRKIGVINSGPFLLRAVPPD